ncbi:MAG: hypothetical protein K0R54_18 [Clostridiaceae bacterium]|jgi:hypothetical protein|nr:hypothetical protein [Clostridiaceae bacterium]
MILMGYIGLCIPKVVSIEMIMKTTNKGGL